MKRIQAIVSLSGDHTLGIAECRENMGHDDSLPYQAEIWFRIKDTWKRLGSVWNDGWGGQSCLETRREDPDGTLTSLADSLCRKHKMHLGFGLPDVEYTLEMTLNCMAEGWVDRHSRVGRNTLVFAFDDEVSGKRRGSNFSISKGATEFKENI